VKQPQKNTMQLTVAVSTWRWLYCFVLSQANSLRYWLCC